MACEIMLQRGKTLANMLNARLETAADAIIVRHYTRAADFPKAPLPALPARQGWRCWWRGLGMRVEWRRGRFDYGL
jgi:hypothetical protein